MSVAVSQAPNIPQTSSSSSLCASNSASGSSSRPLSLAPPPASHSRAPSPSHHGSSPLSARKIRFAPLPDPRRAVLVTENGEEVPIPNGEEATQISLSPAMAAFDSTTVLDNSSLSSFGSSKRNSDTDPSTTPGTTTPASTPSEYGNSRPGSPSASPISLPPPLPNVQSIPTAQRPKSKGLSFLKSLKRSSASSSSSNTTLTPTPSIERQSNGAAGGARDRKSITTEEILTLGTINLFRTSSRESTKSTESGSGWNLTRWTSSTSGQPPVKQWGAPLSRSQSSQSHRSKTPSLLSGLRPSSSSGGRSKKQAPVRKGTRMLNGRVYGGRGLNPNSNLFANAPDVEPEFVEWGHGGMGSVQGVKSAGANSKWQRLGASNDEELDDGGGMAWVKKRKEERERKEREEKEKAEREAATVDAAAAAAAAAPEAKPDEETNVDVVPISPPASESAMPTPRASTPSVAPNPHARVSSASINTHHSASTAVPATPVITPSTPADLTTPTGHHGGDDDHVFKTMAVPMQPRHRRARSRDGLSPPGSPDEIKNSYFDVHVLDKRSSSGSSSETDSTSSEDEEDDDDDEEDEEELERRKAMVIGAGMEKISRHREHEETPQSS